MTADLLLLGLFAALVFVAWAFVHLCDWLTEPVGTRFTEDERTR